MLDNKGGGGARCYKQRSLSSRLETWGWGSLKEEYGRGLHNVVIINCLLTEYEVFTGKSQTEVCFVLTEL